MKKLKITNISLLGVALLVEALFKGVKVEWLSFFYESETYHSFFDLTVWESGNVGPFLCAIFTGVLFCMAVVSLVLNPGRIYYLSMAAVTLVAVVFSLISTFYGAYTLIGLIVTVLLSVSLELCAMMYLDMKKENN